MESSLGLQVKSHSEGTILYQFPPVSLFTSPLVSVSEEDRDTVGHLPSLLQKMVRTQGHRKALFSILDLLQPNSH